MCAGFSWSQSIVTAFFEKFLIFANVFLQWSILADALKATSSTAAGTFTHCNHARYLLLVRYLVENKKCLFTIFCSDSKGTDELTSL